MITIDEIDEYIKKFNNKNHNDHADIMIKFGNALSRPDSSNFDPNIIAKIKKLLYDIEAFLISNNPSEGDNINIMFNLFTKQILKIEASMPLKDQGNLSYIDHAVELGSELKTYSNTVRILHLSSVAFFIIPVFGG